MTSAPRAVAPLRLPLLASAGALAVSALLTGPLAAFLASPLVLALCAQGLGVLRTEARRLPARCAVLGIVTLGLGLLLAAAGPTWAGVTSAALGGWLVARAARHSLAEAPVPEELPRREGAPLAIGVAADLTVQGVWEAGARFTRRSDWAPLAAAAETLARRNAERGWTRRPEGAHPLPPPLEKAALEPRTRPGLGRFEVLRFASEFEPGESDVRVRFLEGARNREAVAYLWRHPDGPRPTLICVHGFGMGRVAWDVWRWDVRWLHRELGIDVVLPVLPFHGPRAEGLWSGLRFFDAHPGWTAAAFAQSIWDLRRLAGWLRAQGAPAVGVHGLSLGGCLAALYASLDGELATAVAMFPAVEPARLWWGQLAESERRAAEAAGFTLARLEQAWAPCDPLRHRPRAPFEARLVVGASADRVVPPAQPLALWEHWGRPALHWLPGTHLLWLGRRELRNRLESHLRATLLAHTPPAAPQLSRFRGAR